MGSMTALTNQLGSETSPYLLQHSQQPVAWQTWGQQALDIARLEDKPILLSIGYSACHWCHMMAADAFSNQAIADTLNDDFICIKVDREERPDLDDIYQTAHQLLTGQPGGWPLTVFLCPQTQLPFIAGTYFPAEESHGRVGLKDVLAKVNYFYRQQHSEFRVLREKVRQGYEKLEVLASEKETLLNPAPIDVALHHLLRLADDTHGGFGGAPKFPMSVNLNYLQRAYEQAADPATGRHLLLSLLKMAQGGIHDHVGGGFYRYATDVQWEIPHFEKMLSDNALLMANYAEAWSISGEPLFKRTAADIFKFVQRAFANGKEGFYSSVDADSEGSEGGYYLWRHEEIQALLSDDELALLTCLQGQPDKHNFGEYLHLHFEKTLVEAAAECELSYDQALAQFLTLKEKLLQARLQRPQPHIDNKVLCGWNALWVRALAIAARVFNDQEYLTHAQQGMDFIRQNLWRKRRLLATWQQGSAKHAGYLDDYAYTMDALLELLQVQWRDEDYQLLINLAESLSNNFYDQQQGGFFFTAHDHEPLIYRSKPLIDSVLPSGNGVAARALLRLGHLAAEPRYLAMAEATLGYAWMGISSIPETHVSLLQALQEFFETPVQVFLLGDDVLAWRQLIQDQFGHRVHCYAVPSNAELYPPEMMSMDMGQAVICVQDRCLPPYKNVAELIQGIAEQVKPA